MSVAQITIKGNVVDDNNISLPFVNISIFDSKTDSIINVESSDLDGIFEFQLKDTNIKLEFSMLGYQNYSIDDIQSFEENTTVKLQFQSHALEGVEVTAKRPVYESKIDRMVVNVKNAVASAGGNALEILERSPGVTVDRINNVLSLLGKNGVTVTINGKVSRLENDALIQMLASMSSEQIEKVELIHNPPSSYDAQGDGGIINIILSRNKGEGLTGVASANIGYGERVKYGGSLSMSFNREAFSIYFQANTDHDYTNQNTMLNQQIYYESGLLDTEQFNQRPPYLGNHSGKLGIDWNLNENLSLNSYISGSYRDWQMNSTAKTTYNQPFQNLLKENINSFETNTTEHFIISNSLRYTFADQSYVSFDYDILEYVIDNPTDYNLSQKLANSNDIKELNFKSTKESPFNFMVYKFDYGTKLLDRFNFSAGLKATISDVENFTELIYYENTIEVKDDFFSDELQMDENIYAAYISLDGELTNKISISGGLRYENAQTNLVSNFDGDLLERNLSRLFPTFNLSYKLNETNSLSFTFNERINRPSFQVLAPAFYFFDTRSVLSGNINAIPTISQNASLALNVDGLNVTLGYTNEINPLAWGQPLLSESEDILILRPSNSQKRQMFNLSVSYPLKFTDFWSTRFNVIFLQRKEVPVLEGQTISIHNFMTYGNVSQSFKIGEGLEAEVTHTFNSAVALGIAYFQPRFATGIGIKKTFKSGASLALAWNDIFNLGSHFNLVVDNPNVNTNYNWLYQLEGNIVRCTFRMPFGHKTNKQVGDRSSASDDIRNRAAQ